MRSFEVVMAHRRVVARVLLVLAFLGMLSRESRAWNPFSALADGARRVAGVISGAGRAVGGVVGSPLGGFVQAATVPTVQSVESSGRSLIHEVDGSLNQRIGQAHTVASSLLVGANEAVAKNLANVDRSLEARILQITTSTEGLMYQAGGIVDATGTRLIREAKRNVDDTIARSIGLADASARQRIDQVFNRSEGLVGVAAAALGAEAKKALAQVDLVLQARVDQVGGLVQDALKTADRALEERINQVDLSVERRLGNVDVIGTKAALNVERTAVRVAALVGGFVFFAFALWRIWMERSRAVKKYHKKELKSAGEVTRVTAMRSSVQTLAAAMCMALLFFVGEYLPLGAKQEADALRRSHASALATAVQTMDLALARYHAAQLLILDPDATGYRGQVLKVELLREVFARPIQLTTAEGIQQLHVKVLEVEAFTPGDPDLDVIKAYISWQAGGTRHSEREAATLCAKALKEKCEDDCRFVLRPLARHYLSTYLWRPLTADVEPAAKDDPLAEWARVVDATPKAEAFAPLQHVIDYDRAVMALQSASTAAYLEMLEAQADVELETDGVRVANARDRRNAAAARVVDAWATFDRTLQTNAWLTGTSTVLAAFQLNDALLTHALWFLHEPSVVTSHPGFAVLTARPEENLRTLVKVAPLRVAWGHRYLGRMGPGMQELISYQEAQRFESFDAATVELDRAFVEHARARKEGKEVDRRRAALAAAAARLGLYVKAGDREVPYGIQLLSGAPTTPDIDDVRSAYVVRQLRLL